MILASLDEDPKKIVSMIKAEISSLKKSSRFIDYYESGDFATKIDQLRMHITRDNLNRDFENFNKQSKQIINLKIALSYEELQENKKLGKKTLNNTRIIIGMIIFP